MYCRAIVYCHFAVNFSMRLCVSHFNLRPKWSRLRSRRLEVVGERENGRARRRHAREVGSSLTPRMSPSRAFVLSFTHYFQAPATQARNDRAANEKLLTWARNLVLIFAVFAVFPVIRKNKFPQIKMTANLFSQKFTPESIYKIQKYSTKKLCLHNLPQKQNGIDIEYRYRTV